MKENINYIGGNSNAKNNNQTINPAKLPCDIACSKCGSQNVNKTFRNKGSQVDSIGYDKKPNKYTTGQCHYWETIKDHIDYTFRCCHYRWQSLPLPKNTIKKTKTPNELEGWIPLTDRYPTPSCDINDLLLWCPDHGMGLTLVLGQYDGKSFTAYFEIDDKFNEVSRKKLYVTHWKPAPHLGPNLEQKIMIRKDAI